MKDRLRPLVLVVDDEARRQIVQRFLGPGTGRRCCHKRAREPLELRLHPEPAGRDDEVIGRFVAQGAVEISLERVSPEFESLELDVAGREVDGHSLLIVGGRIRLDALVRRLGRCPAPALVQRLGACEFLRHQARIDRCVQASERDLCFIGLGAQREVEIHSPQSLDCARVIPGGFGRLPESQPGDVRPGELLPDQRFVNDDGTAKIVETFSSFSLGKRRVFGQVAFDVSRRKCREDPIGGFVALELEERLPCVEARVIPNRRRRKRAHADQGQRGGSVLLIVEETDSAHEVGEHGRQRLLLTRHEPHGLDVGRNLGMLGRCETDRRSGGSGRLLTAERRGGASDEDNG